MMYVAKSYQNMERVGEPFEENNRLYTFVTNGKTNRKVRLYSLAEYKKMYPEDEIQGPNQKKMLGFEKGYITIFKGDQIPHNEWFKRSNARYSTFWGWYVVSTEEIPEDLPKTLTPVRLNWDKVSAANGISLKPESIIKPYIEAILYDGVSDSQFVGEIGDKLTLEVTVSANIPLDGIYGRSNMHIMEDILGNVYVWTTAARSLIVGNKYTLKGNVKDHKTYKGVNQTILTRCREVAA